MSEHSRMFLSLSPFLFLPPSPQPSLSLDLIAGLLKTVCAKVFEWEEGSPGPSSVVSHCGPCMGCGGPWWPPVSGRG